MGKWRDSKPSQMDSQRALLDQLMGVNRNLDNEDAVINDFQDERVCKAFLCGLCPHDLFSNTKQDLGACDCHHDDDLKKEYQDKVKDGSDFGYEEELEAILVNHIAEVDKKIMRSQRRLDEGGQGALKVDSAALRKNEEIIKLEAQVSEIMKNAEAKGEEGEVDEAQELFQKAEELQQQKSTLEAKALQESIAESRAASAPIPLSTTNPTAKELGNATQQKLRVCDICGALLSIFDSNDRLAEHFGGKLHIGFVDIRNKLEEIRKNKEEKRLRRRKDAETKAIDSKSGRDRARSRSRDRARSRSRDRDRSRDRGKDRSRDRDRGRGRDRGRDRSRESDWDRDRDRDRRYRDDRHDRDDSWDRRR
ncbi:unnamed protein product [Discosporangium mesarthrocarpum]